MKKNWRGVIGVLMILSSAMPGLAAWFEDDFTEWRVSNVVWTKTNPGAQLPFIDWSNRIMCVGHDTNGGTGYTTNIDNGYAWKSGIATFWVKDWGAGAAFGVKSAGNALGFRNDVYDTECATVYINGTWYQEGLGNWPASWSGTVASVTQIEWDNVAGQVTFRYFDNTSRTVAPGVLPASWQGEVTYTFTPSDEPMYIFTYSYGAPYTYFEYVRAEPRPSAAAPVFSPDSRYISGPTPITLTCATPGASIYYTLNDEPPTMLYTGPIEMNLGEKLSAYATAPGYENSPETSVIYLPKFTLPVVMEDGFTNWRVSYCIWEKTNPGETLPLIDWGNSYMCVGYDGHGTGYQTQTKYGYAWKQGVATFWVKDWGAGAVFGIQSPNGALSMGFRNDVNDTECATAFINNTFNQEGFWQWPASWYGTVASVVQVAWDNVAGKVTFRYFDNTGRAVAPGTLPASWQGEATYSFTPTDEPMSLFTYDYGGPFTYFEYIRTEQPAMAGDANRDNKVDVSDLGILAANYGMTSGATWDKGDFNGDGKVDVSDLGILAANYGTGTGTSLDFNADAQALGLTAEAKEEAPAASALGCGSVGLPLAVGLALMGLFLAKLEE